MKFTNSVALTLASAGTLAAAHGHGHARFHRRAVETEVNTVAVPGPTVYDFVVVDPQHSGKPEPISNKDACAGLKDHELEWLGKPVPAACPTSSSTSTPTPTPTPSSTSTPQVLEQSSAIISPSSSSSTSTVTPTSSSTSTPVAVSTSSASAGGSGGSGGSSNSGGQGIDRDFPDGEIDCSSFPSEYGAIPLDYLGLGGYSGIQYVTIVGEVVSHIVTAITGESCTDGAMCSYACPPGYQKSQWPTTQGSTGQSVGGLQCKNGKLHLTNKEFGKKLCIEGNGGVSVHNKMTEHVAVCRTDYPGTESETIPLHAGAGQEHPLTCPNGNTYFKWGGKDTSAQYYVNNKGISTQDGCQWGDGKKTLGNFAPMNLGVGYNAGSTWLSIFKNQPTTDADLDFKVSIVGDSNNLIGSCSWDGKKFTSESGSDGTASGCTVNFTHGSAKYVFEPLD
ncbi:cell wall synthesis protein [Penicillium capsulatum]|uniref:Cell wall synthesis protein n=1 Tax=Penicillium capsulatum TaxID=69766 RepID=A0A9W9IU72_9EURO|nr:cell wall synthesis protein [Penicillium capsulatum]KAJ6130190.1 cell wall synthesis protein [Penicillium capsulatum]